jgi:hypothetical protein
MTGRLLDHESAIDGGDATFLANQLASAAALGTLGGVGRLRRDGAHLPSLDSAAEFLPQLVGTGFDHRVMGNSDDRAVGAIEGYGDFGRLAQELIEFFLQFGRRPIHGLTPSVPSLGPPKHLSVAIYHRMPVFSY